VVTADPSGTGQIKNGVAGSPWTSILAIKATSDSSLGGNNLTQPQPYFLHE